MDPFIIKQYVDIVDGSLPMYYTPQLEQGDNGAHRWEVTVTQRGKAAELSGSVTCFAVRSDGKLGSVKGAIAGNVVTATFDSTFTKAEGQTIAQMVISDADGRQMKLAELYYGVRRTRTGELVTADERVIDLAGMMAMLDEFRAAETAREAAEQARENAEAQRAQTFAGFEGEIGSLKDDLAELSIIPIMNRIVKIDTGHYWGNDGALNENSGYDAVTIEVEGGKSYSINKNFIGGQNFNVFTDGAGNVLGKYTSDNVTEIGNGWYFTAIEGAKYLKASIGTTTYWNDFIAIEGVHDISKVTIQDWPIGEVKKEHINVPFELMDGTVVDDELKKHENHLADLDSIVGGFVYQYIDKTQYNDGHFWGMDAGTHKVGLGSNQYFSAVKVENVPKGEYKISKNFSSTFTFIENIETGSFDNISSFYTTSGDSYKNINVDFNFNLYLTIDYWRDKELFMLVDGDMPSRYVLGKYDIDLNNTYLGNKVPVVIYCGVSRDYTTLKSAIEKATEYMDATVYVDDGTYDLVEEFDTDYLDSYSGTDSIGLVLKNRVRIVFSSGAKVVFDYQGTNEKVHEYFSPFNSGKYGFTLENAYVESKNCRYSVHDERAQDTDSYHNIYKHCTFIHDSSQASGWHGAQAIGGGLGKYGDILIEDCYCKSVSNDDTISYHSTTISEEGNDAKSKIVVRGTYTSGTLDFIQLGNSTEKTQILVSGCNLRIAPKIEGSVNTMELISWGNIIRE